MGPPPGPYYVPAPPPYATRKTGPGVGALIVLVAIITALAGVTALVVLADRSGIGTKTSPSASAPIDTEPTAAVPTAADPLVPTITTPPAPILYGGIAFSGSGAHASQWNQPDPSTAKSQALQLCNDAIHNNGWSADSYCGYVPIQTDECASVATATVDSGWGPTGWASGSNSRERVITQAITSCTSLGQGVCHELHTLCM